MTMRADCWTTASSSCCAKNTRNVWMSAMMSARNGAATSANSTAVAALSSPTKARQALRCPAGDAARASVITGALLHEAGGARRDLQEQIGQRRRNVAARLNVREQARGGAGFQSLCDRARRGRRVVELRYVAVVPAVRQLQILGVEDRDPNVLGLDRVAYRRVERLLA